jgi:hypothetical protein
MRVTIGSHSRPLPASRKRVEQMTQTTTLFQGAFEAVGDRNPNVKGTHRLLTVRRRVDGVQLLIEGDAVGYDGLYTVSDVVVPDRDWDAQQHLVLAGPFTKVYVDTRVDGRFPAPEYGGRPFNVRATLRDGDYRRATVYGFGPTYRDQLDYAVAEAKWMFKDAETVEVQ